MNSLITHQILDFTQKTSLEEDTIVDKEKPVAFESDEPDAKRPKLMNAYAVPDSPGANNGHDADVSVVESPSSFPEYVNSVTDEILDLTQKTTSLEEDTLVSDKKETVAFESDEADAKRPSIMNEGGGPRRRLTRSMLKEACV